MDIGKEAKDEFLPRPYQQEIGEIAYKRNTIIYLPTGSGKTFIAVMLINRMCHSIVSENSKTKTVVLVNTVPLVEQHCLTLQRHTDFDIGGFSGDQNVDMWTKEQWNAQLKKHQIIVLTAQIFLDIVRHGYYNLENVNLIVFDECHQAVYDQPMRQLMQLFANVDLKKQPRVLGLTATLLNGNCTPSRVMEEVETLETTFHSKVATVSDMAQVAGYSTKPQENLVFFSTTNSPNTEKALRMLYDLKNILDEYKFTTVATPTRRHLQLLDSPGKEGHSLKKKIGSLIEHIQMCGVFGGAKATLATLVSIEHMKRRADDQSNLYALLVSSTRLTCVLRILNTMLQQFDVKQQLYKFSSMKILTLFEVLRQKKSESTEPLCGLLFVKQRFTAKVLFYIIKALSESDPDFSDVLPNFIVGFNAPSMDRNTREMLYTAKLNKRIIKNFQDGEVNLLIASSVLEEGIDIPKCTLVIKFDQPMDYRSYIQSKGRARHDKSDYVIMVPEKDKPKYIAKYETFQLVEKMLRKYLTGQNECRTTPTLARIERELYEDQDVQPYYVDGLDSAHVSAQSAISLLNRYCQSLQRDKYAVLVPIWYVRDVLKNDLSHYQVIIELPILCPLRDPVVGPPMSTKVSAKRVAALETCKKLHKIGELNQRLLPQAEDELTLNLDFLYPQWMNEIRDSKAYPGTNKYVRQHSIYVPEVILQGSHEIANTYYLHIIEIQSLFDAGESEYNLYIQNTLINSELGYGFLTLKPLPELCDFPIYISAGELTVHLEVNHRTLSLTYDDVLRLRKFNNFVYAELLKIVRTFLVFDNSPTAAVMLLAPTIKVNGNYKVAMDIADAHTKLVEIKEPTGQNKVDMTVQEEDYVGKIVCPWYRHIDTQYIVSRVCYEMNANSQFPSNDFSSYAEYYDKKYGLVIKNPSLPLLLVKAISKRLNCILPRSVTLHSKRKKHEVQEGWEEHLIPEMCVVQQYPGALWYKAHLLPTILHRTMRLLQSEHLRRKISLYTGLGSLDLPAGINWEKLPIDQRILKGDANVKIQPVPTRNVSNSDHAALPENTKKPKKLTNKDYSNKMLERMYPWKDEQEPVDIDRNMESVTAMEIEDYESFCANKDLVGDEDAVQTSINRIHGNNLLALPMDNEYREQPIRLLSQKENLLGPQLWKLFQATTANKAVDIVNLERLETLGDSFLKASVSVYLYLRFPNYSEGILTNIKGKTIGNRNLLYCALAKRLGGYIKAGEFSALNDWIPPGFSVPQVLKDKINNNLISVNRLYEFEWSMEEVVTGIVELDTVEQVGDSLQECFLLEAPADNSSMDRFIGCQHLRDKTLSDSVEALIGVYLESNGIVGGLHVLDWFDIIPRSECPSKLFTKKLPSPLLRDCSNVADVDFLLPNYHRLEQQLGYTFRNRGYLLQALTHASYAANRITDCYQRLEFLGDAILDFLITCHIYEQCDELTPGQLTDLRSALVNNVTFASLAVRCGFHKHLKFINAKLMDIMDMFVKFQEERNFVINEDILTLVEEHPMYLAEQVHVPKVLGDLFESLAGAVFLDTGMDFQRTWHVFHRIMWREINLFMKSIPKNPVRLLYECVGAAPEFSSPQLLDNGCIMISCSIMVNGKKNVVHGFGENKAQAKRAAAKLSLRLIG